MVEIAIGHALKQFHNVRLETRHDSLRLGVAHATIIFYHLGLAFAVDKTEENKTFIIQALLSQTLDRGLHNSLFNFFHPLLIGKRNGRNTAHATGVETGVVFSNALIVFCLGQYGIVLTICQCKHAVKIFLDNHTRRSVAKLSTKHFAKFLFGLLEIRDYQNTLAGTKAIGLQHIGRTQRLQKRLGLCQLSAGERLVGGRWNIVAHHKSFGKIF